MPAAAIPRTTLRRGGALVIVNDMKTPLDDDAAMRFWDLEELFAGLGELLDRTPGSLYTSGKP
jgi:NAD-dependent deacetylase